MEAISASSFQKIPKEEFWKNHFKEQEKSGKTRKKYCEDQGISCVQFGYWLRKISCKENSTENSLAPLVGVKLKPQNEQIASATIGTLILKNGCLLKIHTMEALSYILERIN